MDIGVDPVSAAVGIVGVIIAVVSIRLTIRFAKQPTPEPPPEPTSLFEGYEISPKVEDVASSPLIHAHGIWYAHGIWRLNSYVAVERPAGIWQGILARQLIPISLDEVAG